VATPTLANFPNPHQLRAENLWTVAARTQTGKPEFLVLATGEPEYHWGIADVAANRMISRHKSLAYALRKCTRLNEQRDKAQLNPLDIALSGFPDVNTYRAYYEGLGNDFE